MRDNNLVSVRLAIKLFDAFTCFSVFNNSNQI